MEITTDVLDIEAYERQKLAPATLVSRKGSVWITREVPLLVEKEGEWGWCKDGDMVRIPMFPYLTRGHDPSIAMGFAFELGFRARDFVDPRYDVERLHITIGHPVCNHTMSDGNEMLRFWLGFGFVVKEKSCRPI